MAAMWRWMRLPEAEILPGITPASASTPNNEPLIAPGAHLAAATLCPPNNRKTFIGVVRFMKQQVESGTHIFGFLLFSHFIDLVTCIKV